MILASIFLFINFKIVLAVRVTNPENLVNIDTSKFNVQAIQVGDQTQWDVTEKSAWERAMDQITTWAKRAKELADSLAGSQALNKAIQTALNEIAYDTATWLASGGKGQQPMFITEGWSEYLKNVADQAGGRFIETLGTVGALGTKFNLCEPNLQVKLRIGLGLVQYQKPSPPACTFSQMAKNWQNELQNPQFLNKFQDMFNPASNDLGIALTLQTGIIENQQYNLGIAKDERTVGKGWLNITDIGGRQLTPPEEAARRAEQVRNLQAFNLGQYTGNALTDAANVFLNQLAITLFNNLMNKLGQGLSTYTSPYSGNYGGLTQYNAAPESGGIAGAKEMLRKLIEPNFSTRGDYNILAELSTCQDPNKAGPTNCVIEDKLKQAIANKMTVGEALKQGYLNGNGVFGFNSDGLEPKYNEGYPYRSMIILRKFRIIPLGWEVAAQYIKDHPGDIDGTKNLADLVNCFSADDDYSGYSANWCKGLVDPNWVLKAPLNYCKREGPGPEIMSEQVTGQGYNSKLAVVRNDKYCADEQSCIKENNDGSCKLYGYCTEERRKWDFAGASCDTNYNTCQTFRGAKGQTISYLENTLDYGLCNIDNVGCKAYCADYNPATTAATNSLPTGAAAYWKLDEGSGSTASDASGNGHNGNIINNGSWVSGKFNQALHLNGSNQYVSVNNSTSLNFGSGSFTVGGWVEYDDCSGNECRSRFINKWDCTGTQKGWALDINRTDADGNMIKGAIRIRFLSGTNNLNYNINAGLQPGVWYNIFMVVDRTSSIIKIYVNGQQVSDDSQASIAGFGDINTPGSNLGIGFIPCQVGGLPEDYHRGSVDEVVAYSRALSATEIKNYYDRASGASSGSWECTASTGNKIYLNGNAETCDQANQGCHELIRLKPGTGVNLLTNSSFENTLSGTVWQGAGTQVNDAYDGTQALKLTGALTKSIAVGPADYPVRGEIFNLSFYAKDCGLADNFKITGQAQATNLNQGAAWQRYQTSYIFPTTATGNQVSFTINTSSCLIDAIKLERGNQVSTYDDYRASGLIYEKLAPNYLNCSSANAPAECNNYVRSCGVNEVGCERYTSVKDNIGVAAKVLAQDRCPAECLGYDTYIQGETVFDSSRDAYFIPKTAKSCNASGAGCDQFTNLDEVARGGEGIEYYTYLRQCIKPSTTDCAEFYTWEGSDETGFQLRVNSLKANQSTGEPQVSQADSLACNESIYNLAATNPSYNTDCRQFYNRAGQISYHLYKSTISCDDNCHPYRRTALNTNPSITDAGGCSGADKHWDSASSQCVVCKNGGTYDSQHGACLYLAVPGQGQSCSVAENGCREYTGNIGNNAMFIINNDFESGTVQNWTGLTGTNVSPSSDSLVVGGHSLAVSGGNGNPTAKAVVGQAVTNGKAYVLTFLAKAPAATKLSSIKLINGSNQAGDFSTTNLTSSWNTYSVSLADLNQSVDNQESLQITGNGNFLLDDIKLTEITDRYYLIKDSWVTPASCDQDIEGNLSPLYMLGCEAYHDRDNATHNLRSFSFLCQASAVGCELMIDTHNSLSDRSESFNAGAITVPADNYIYVVYDKNKQCNAADKGCQLLGSPYQYADNVIYSSVYLKNDPDKYNKILCSPNEVGCEEWTTSDGTTAYFKDPGDMACEWRQGVGLASNSWGWYLKKIKRCSGNGMICQSDNDCVAPVKCKLETNDYSCTVSAWKTLGYGGEGNRINQPTADATGNLAGLCPASQAGCSELIDPVSNFSSNLIFNSDFSQDVDGNGPDGWSGSTQDVAIEKYTLYRLAHKNNSGALGISCPGNIYQLNNTNNLSAAAISFSLPAATVENSLNFYSANNNSCSVNVSNPSGEVELKKVIVDYQLNKELDKQSCNGVVDFDQGCVLFNQRKQSGTTLAGLTWDADLTINDGSGVPPKSGVSPDRDANVLLKVTPDRVCNKWLACRSYIKDEKDNNVCFDIGLCDSVDNNGYCNNYVITNQSNQTYPSPFDQNKINNAAGYAKAGYLSTNSLNSDYYALGAMKQVGEVANLANGGFEYAGSNGYPVGWNWPNPIGSWQASVFTVINNPIAAQNEGVGNAPEGNNFLKLGSSFSAQSEYVDVMGSNALGSDGQPGIPYVLTAYINTINLKSGSARVIVEGFDSSGNSQGNLPFSPEVTLPAGYGWTFKLGKFSVNNQAITRVKVTLGTPSANTGPVAYWNFDQGSGSTVTDVSGNHHNGTIISSDNTNWVSGEINGALHLNGTNQYVSVNDSPSLRFGTGSFTVGGWINYDDCSGDACRGRFINKYLSSGTASKGWLLDINRADAAGTTIKGSIRAKFTDYSGHDFNYYIVNADSDHNAPLQPGVWYSFFMVVDRDNGNNIFKLYVNGQKVSNDAQSSLAGFGDFDSNTNLGIGFIPSQVVPGGDTTDYLGGAVDEVAIYKRVLNAAEIKDYYIKTTSGGGVSGAPGNFYFDDVKIKPSLDTKNISVTGGVRNDWYTPQTCRLYPQTDALSCEYYDDSGKLQRGLSGYCLEYDRSPGSPDACLLWWPVDKVKGQGVEEGAGYNDKFPLYYCLDAGAYCDTNNVPHSYCTTLVQTVDAVGQNKYWAGRVYQGSDYNTANSNGSYIDYGYSHGGIRQVGNGYYTYADDSSPFGSLVAPTPLTNPFEWDTTTRIGNQPLYVEINNGSDQPRVGSPYYCNDSQTCSAVDLGCWFGANFAPGCAPQREDDADHTFTLPSYNKQWDYCQIEHDRPDGVCGLPGGKSCFSDNAGSCIDSTDACGLTSGSGSNRCSGADCKYVTFHDYKSNGGDDWAAVRCYFSAACHVNESQSAGVDRIKRLFAQSYGAWTWQQDGATPDVGHYVSADSPIWGPPEVSCPAGGRPDYSAGSSADYCAILPAIPPDKIRINNSTNNIEITKNQFINLTFTTNVDSEQLPITMYGINWGDGEYTTVSGVEMRSRDANNPFSLYHLYSYWDLKAKASSGRILASSCGYNTTYGNYCSVKPQVQIKDNWGWCNHGAAINVCGSGQWDSFNGWVVVKEK